MGERVREVRLVRRGGLPRRCDARAGGPPKRGRARVGSAAGGAGPGLEYRGSGVSGARGGGRSPSRG